MRLDRFCSNRSSPRRGRSWHASRCDPSSSPFIFLIRQVFRWPWREGNTRSHSEHGSEGSLRRGYCGGCPWESSAPPEFFFARTAPRRRAAPWKSQAGRFRARPFFLPRHRHACQWYRSVPYPASPYPSIKCLFMHDLCAFARTMCAAVNKMSVPLPLCTLVLFIRGIAIETAPFGH